MLRLGLQASSQRIRDVNRLVDRFALLILLALMALAALQRYTILVRTDGGADLVQADIPKSLMLLRGENPYSVQPWASPYPPFFLVVVGGIIAATSGQDASSAPVGFVARNIMLAGLLSSLIVGVLVFLVLRKRGFMGFQLLVPTAVFLLLPSISTSPFFFFHSDVFGYPLLAGGLLALVAGRFWTGSTLLAVGAVFKLHPLLALLLILAWIVRRTGFRRALPSIATSTTILSMGIVAPLWLPGYAGAVLGFNLSGASGTVSFSVMNVFYGVLPAMGWSIPVSWVNEVWMVITTMLFFVMLMEVWSRAGVMGPVDVVLLGLTAWLLPLRQLYTHYVVWAMIPFLMRGRLVATLLGAGLLELANTMAVWSWNVPPNPLPLMNSAGGFFLTSLVYAGFSLLAMGSVMRDQGSAFGPVTRGDSSVVPPSS